MQRTRYWLRENWRTANIVVVLSAFRQHFIKAGLLSSELSEIYGQVMDDRHEGDYEILATTSKEDAEIDLLQAHHFVDEVKSWLRREKWL